MNPNHDICELLLEIANYEQNVNRSVFKSRAYRKAIRSLSEMKTRVESGKEAMKLPSIGKSIAAKIDEFLNNGKIKKLNSIRSSSDFGALSDLQRVSGIGPVFAKRLIETGIDSVEMLRKNTHLLNEWQKICLKYLDEFEQKIPNFEIRRMEALLLKEAKRIDKTIEITICGSFRRGCTESGDIDVLVTDYHSKNFLSLLLQSLQNIGFISDSLAHGDTKFMGVCCLKEIGIHRRIDIRFFPNSQYYCGVLYFTGSSMFNQEMRRHALNEGYTLNEHSLRKLGSTGVPGEELCITSEREIFDYINFPYKDPKDRDW